MADYAAVSDTPIATPDSNIWGINTSIPQAQSQIPSIPDLPKLDALPNFFGEGGTADQWLKKNIPGWGTLTGINDTVETGFKLASDPGRVITVAVGLLFIFGAMYLLGTSQIENAIRKAVK